MGNEPCIFCTIFHALSVEDAENDRMSRLSNVFFRNVMEIHTAFAILKSVKVNNS